MSFAESGILISCLLIMIYVSTNVSSSVSDECVYVCVCACVYVHVCVFVGEELEACVRGHNARAFYVSPLLSDFTYM